jgi:hypothetical protein
MKKLPLSSIDSKTSSKWDRRALEGIVLFLSGGILYAGLKPFCAPANGVKWISEGNGVRLSEHGTIVGSDSYPLSSLGRTLEIWIGKKC